MFVATNLKDNFNFKVKPNSVVIDNLVFKLHYVVTFWLLIICAVLVTSKEYIGEHIKCMAEIGKDDDENHKEKYINTYCFFMSTYTVVRHLNVSAVLKGDVAHPGVGPSIDETDEDIVMHAYYQWVHYVLVLQAVCFLLPRFLWKHWKGKDMKAVLMGFDRRKIMDQLEKRDSLEKIQKSFKKRLDLYQDWAYVLILCEVLNLINIILQIFLTDKFLGGKFMSLGIDLGLRTCDEVSPLDVVFPKVTKCAFRKFGPTGTIMYSDILCVMALNIINEKIFVALWYWFFILLALSILAVLWRLLNFILYSRSKNFNLMTFGVINYMKVDKKDLLKLMKHTNYANWLFLQYLAANMEGDMFENLLHNMSDKTMNRLSKKE